MINTNSSYHHWHINYDAAGICWLHFDKAASRANLLAGETINELSAILDELMQDVPQGIIIMSDKQDSFIFGADIHEFTALENIAQARTFLQRGHDLMNKLDAMPCTTLSMIHGICLGGGTELSLACDYIIASDASETKLGLPEIKLGIFPGYGGTARSIARCGPLPALDMMLTGRMIAARSAKKIGLVDEVVPLRQLKQAAASYILRKPRQKSPPLLQRILSNPLLRPLVAVQMRKQVSRKANIEHYPAPYALIDLWQKHSGSKQKMLHEELETVANLATTPTARNLVRVFFLQEKLKSLGKQVEYTPGHVHVIGGGIMGGDIATWCAIQGYSVSVQDQDTARLSATFKRAHDSFRKKYKRDRRAIRAASDRLMMDHRGHGVARADLVIEAIFEDAEVKRKLYREIEPRMKAGAILATNTSSIMLEELSSSLQQPERLVGLHFFNPVALMPLVEVIRGKDTDEKIMQQALAFARGIGKLPLPTRSSPGFLVNRILMPYLLEAVTMVAEGIPAEVIDLAATEFGMPMGPIELADTVGLDICRNVANILSQALNTPLPDNLDKLVSGGKLGKKSGAGFYQYKDGKAQKNAGARYADMARVKDRLVFRLLNEAVACLRENIVDSDELIDAGVIFGTGFAPFRGGPINYLRAAGLDAMKDGITALHSQYGERFLQDAGWHQLV